MGTFIMIGSAFLCMLLSLRLIKKKGKGVFSNWNLGVDCCYYYSPSFAIRNGSISIVGYQEVLTDGKAVCYSVVRKNWWGKRTVYDQRYISGVYLYPKYFQIDMKDIPNGQNYQVEVFNLYSMAYGQFRVIDGYGPMLLPSEPKSKTG